MKFSELLFQLLTEDQEAIYQKYYSNIDRNVFLKIISADPKTNIKNDKIERIGPYAKILVDMYRKKNLLFEDLLKATEYLTIVYKYNIKLDFNKIKTIADIYEYVKEYIVKNEKSISSILNVLNENEYQTIFNGEKWLVLMPKTEKAAAYLGVNTEWCTTWGKYCLNPDYRDRDNHFESHNSDGPLYIFINKNDENEKYQLHQKTNQFKDSSDNEVESRPNFFNDNLELKKLFFPILFNETEDKDEILKAMTFAKKFLNKDDNDKIFDLYKKIVKNNEILIALNEKDYDLLAKTISDDNVTDITFYKSTIEFTVKKTSPIIDGYNDVIHQMSYYDYNSNETIYEDARYDVNENPEETLYPYLEDYYNKNKKQIENYFLVKNFEELKKIVGLDFSEDETIREKYIDLYSSKTNEEFDRVVTLEKRKYTNILDIQSGYRGNIIEVGIEPFTKFIVSNDIFGISDFNSMIDEYIEQNDLPSEYYEDHNYDRVYPTFDEMESYIDDFFEEYYENDEPTSNCGNDKKELYTIINKFFNNDENSFENDLVNVKLLNPIKFDCEKGVEIFYKNKKTNKTYIGFVKVENLVKYVTIKPLLERKKTT